MKKSIILILVLGIIISISACDTDSVTPSKESLGEFQKEATIEPSVI